MEPYKFSTQISAAYLLECLLLLYQHYPVKSMRYVPRAGGKVYIWFDIGGKEIPKDFTDANEATEYFWQLWESPSELGRLYEADPLLLAQFQPGCTLKPEDLVDEAVAAFLESLSPERKILMIKTLTRQLNPHQVLEALSP